MKIIDTRDLNKRLNELQDLKSTLEDAIAELDLHKAKDRPEDDDEQEDFDEEREELEGAVESAKANFGKDEEEELDELETIESEVSGFRHGETMIDERDFTEYAEQLADDLGYTDGDAKWPFTHIDWEAAAEELKQDYITITYQGTDYYVRA